MPPKGLRGESSGASRSLRDCRRGAALDGTADRHSRYRIGGLWDLVLGFRGTTDRATSVARKSSLVGIVPRRVHGDWVFKELRMAGASIYERMFIVKCCRGAPHQRASYSEQRRLSAAGGLAACSAPTAECPCAGAGGEPELVSCGVRRTDNRSWAIKRLAKPCAAAAHPC